MNRLFSLIFFLLRTTSALLFIYAGASKLASPARFLTEIQAFHLLPYWIAYGTAIVLPWLEVVCGFAIFTLTYSSAAAFLLMIATLSFMAFLSIADLTGNYLECGCFGALDFLGGIRQHMIFNGLLVLALAVTFLRCAKLQRAIDQHQ